MLPSKRFIRECIKKHSKELEHSAKMIMRAQKMEAEGKFEKAIKYYESAKKMLEQAEIMASFIGDKGYQAEAKLLMQMVDEQVCNAITKDFYKGGISH